MRPVALFAFAVALLMASTLFAAPITDAEREAVTKEALRRIRVEPKRRDHASLAAVFDAVFYEAEITIDQGGGSSTSATLQLARQGDTWVELEDPTTDQGLPQLLRLVKKDFVLSSKETAIVFEQVLDQLYPIHEFGDEKEPKEILRKGKAWIFVRGLFFDDKQGFVVTTDEAGRITEIRQQLRLPKK